MGYVVLARKWRPMAFGDLIGQEHVTRTLGNAISSGRIAHAFLFTGVRGVGKTTSARILAKALNCLGSDGADRASSGPTAEPCLRCAACKEIAEGTDVDVREIDGASYNGVDEVRKLQDSLPYRPSRDRYKIFIVDEVHMLSQNAWNALLKTLEEPPEHVKFIFATTEAHKVPVTILSRVQRFDFKLIRAAQIGERLSYVLSQEGIEADAAAISLLSREAAGSMRDAMSMLDQVIAASDGKLLGEELARVLGVADTRALLDLSRAVLDGHGDVALETVAALAENGYDLAHVARDLLNQLRNVVVARVSRDPAPLLDVTQEEVADLEELAGERDVDDLLRVHQGFSRGFDDIVRSAQPRAALEMALLRLARRPAMLPIDDLVTRLAELERRLGGAPPAAGNATGGTSSEPAAPRKSSGGKDASSPNVGPRHAEARTRQDAGQAHSGGEPSSAGSFEDGVEDATPAIESSPDVQHAPPMGKASPITSVPRGLREPGWAPTGAAVHTEPPTSEAVAPTEPEPQVAAGKDPLADAAPAETRRSHETATSREEASEAPIRAWQRVVERVRQSDGKLAALLNHAVVHEATSTRIRVSFERGTVFEEGATTRQAIESVAAAAEHQFGTRPAVEVTNHASGTDTTTLADVVSREREAAKLEAIERARNHPAVAAAAEILGAKVKDIRLPND